MSIVQPRDRSVSGRERAIKSAFFKLTEEKRNNIQSVALVEFAQQGFKKASFNGIIKRSNISKGGMYKYCSSKEELYQYVVELSVQGLIRHVNQFDRNNEESICRRIIRYTEHEFDFYSKNMDYYRLHQRVFIQSNEEIDLELRKQYRDESINIFQKILNSGKEKLKPEILRIYRWVLTGMKNEYYGNMTEMDDLEEVKDTYKAELEKIFGILKQIS